MNQPNLFSLKFPPRITAFAACLILTHPSTALAEAPMHTDDASTMSKGGKKIEVTLAAADKEKGGELLFGLSPAENLELEVLVSTADDDTISPETELDGVGLGAKWVPYQNDIGWSLGARVDLGHSEINEHAAGLKYNEQDYALTGLASYRLANGQILHLNLGMTRTESQAAHETLGTWSIGYELPLVTGLQLTLETYGQEHASPSKAVGLRYEIQDGLKVSGAAGYGNGKSFGQVGMAWEF